MRVKELMTRDVTTIAGNESAADALEKMHKNRIRHLVVVDGRKIVGVVADRDLIGHDDRELTAVRVDDIMSSDPATIEPEDLISRAANRMRGRGIGCLPVVDDGRLVGVLTTTDLLEVLTKSAHADRPSVRDQQVTHAREKQSSSKAPARPGAAAEPARRTRFTARRATPRLRPR